VEGMKVFIKEVRNNVNVVKNYEGEDFISNAKTEVNFVANFDNGDRMNATIETNVCYEDSFFDIGNKIIGLFKEDIQK
jgi:hypothetical protein